MNPNLTSLQQRTLIYLMAMEDESIRWHPLQKKICNDKEEKLFPDAIDGLKALNFIDVFEKDMGDFSIRLRKGIKVSFYRFEPNPLASRLARRMNTSYELVQASLFEEKLELVEKAK